MRRLPRNRRPTHPGEVFLEDFLIPLGITQKEAAERLRISYPRMNEIVNGKRTVTDQPFNLSRFHSVWRHQWDFGGGLLSDWGEKPADETEFISASAFPSRCART